MCSALRKWYSKPVQMQLCIARRMHEGLNPKHTARYPVGARHVHMHADCVTSLRSCHANTAYSAAVTTVCAQYVAIQLSNSAGCESPLLLPIVLCLTVRVASPQSACLSAAAEMHCWQSCQLWHTVLQVSTQHGIGHRLRRAHRTDQAQV
jgi:hypothetical protein